MVLFSQSVRPPRRFTWDAKADPCPYFDNYHKFFVAEMDSKRFVRSNKPTAETYSEDLKALKESEPAPSKRDARDLTWIAK